MAFITIVAIVFVVLQWRCKHRFVAPFALFVVPFAPFALFVSLLVNRSECGILHSKGKVNQSLT